MYSLWLIHRSSITKPLQLHKWVEEVAVVGRVDKMYVSNSNKLQNSGVYQWFYWSIDDAEVNL